MSTDNRAIELVGELRQILSEGGFLLTKLIRNSRDIISCVPTSEKANFVKDLLDQLPIERVQGVRWNVGSDTFSPKIVMKDRSSTRRGLLFKVSFVCDPLGFPVAFMPVAKSLLQDLCQKRWDSPISEEDLVAGAIG